MKVDSGLRGQPSLLVRAARCLFGLHGEEGGSLVEFAVVAPLLVTLLTATTSFSLGFYNYQNLAGATAIAVQAVAATKGAVTDPCNLAMTTLQGALPGWTAANFSYSMSIPDATGTPSPYTGSGSSFTCKAAGSGGADAEYQGTPVVLTVSYKYSWLSVLHSSPSSPLAATQAAMAD
jgi:Flp pilus assembly protein TadG